MDKLTPDAVLTFLWVAAALVAFTLSVWALVEKIAKARKPRVELAQWQHDTDEKLKTDKKRLDTLEDGQTALVKAMLAMLSHEITGNSVDKLKEAQTTLTNWLIER